MRLLSAILGLWVLAAATAPGAQELTPYMPVSEFGSPGVNAEPSRPELSAAERQMLESFITGLGPQPFPNYPFSGCQDRAQAAYMMLPDALKAKAAKIWVASPAVLTLGMPGHVRLRATDPTSAQVDWGHHVALAFQVEGRLMVYDAVLAPGELIDHEAWMARMVISPRSVWTLTGGDTYLFYTQTFPAGAYVVNRDVWSGNTAPYFGSWVAESWVPRSLARDAVAVEAMAGRACPQLTAMISRPGDLQGALLQPDAVVATACRPSVELFERERQRWSARLGGSPA